VPLGQEAGGEHGGHEHEHGAEDGDQEQDEAAGAPGGDALQGARDGHEVERGQQDADEPHERRLRLSTIPRSDWPARMRAAPSRTSSTSASGMAKADRSRQ
jgi:hypothetical protein